MTASAATAGYALDPVTLEIAWGRLQAVTDEAEVTLVRTSFSPIIREAFDFAVMVMDGDGGAVTQSQRSMPSFVGTLPRTLQAVIARFPAGTWRQGDVLGTNDPWLGTGHLPDMTMVRPVFRKGRVIAYIGCIGHWADIGGAIWSADSHEMFEEGLRVPPSKLVSGGRVNQDVLNIILNNVRLPEQVRGDIYAQFATMEVGERRLNELLDQIGLEDPAPIFAEVQRRSEAAMREAIAALPDGTYVHEMEIDGVDHPLLLRAAVTVTGDEMHIDWTGSSAQTEWAINDSFNHAYAMSVYPVKCALCPDVPNNQGAIRPISMTAPEGTIVNCKYPAAVASRQIIGHCLSAVVFGALAQVVPDHVLADSGSPCPRFVFTGMLADGRKFGAAFLLSGGMGAQSSRDGLSAAPWPSNAGTTSAEIVESNTPLLFRHRALIPDSGGGGKFRGGLGVATEIELRGDRSAILSMMTDRMEHPPQGLYGGLPGTPNVLRRSSGQPIHPKSRTEVKPGEVVVMHTPGGGGFGPPAERERELIERDLEYGYVTPEASRRLYGGGTPKGGAIGMPEFKGVAEVVGGGLPESRVTASSTALMVIDMQYMDAHRDYGLGARGQINGWTDEMEYYFGRLETLTVPNIARLIAACRSSGIPIVHVRVMNLAADSSDTSWRYKMMGVLVPPGSKDSEILEELQPAPGEVVINKTTSSVFMSSNADFVLRNMGVDTLIVTGVVTNNCVESSTRSAADLGYRVLLVEDSCAAWTAVGHEAALRHLDHNYAIVRSTASVLEEIAAAAPARPVGAS